MAIRRCCCCTRLQRDSVQTRGGGGPQALPREPKQTFDQIPVAVAAEPGSQYASTLGAAAVAVAWDGNGNGNGVGEEGRAVDTNPSPSTGVRSHAMGMAGFFDRWSDHSSDTNEHTDLLPAGRRQLNLAMATSTAQSSSFSKAGGVYFPV